MKKNKNGCDLQSCFLCKQSLPEWLPAIAAHKKTYSYKKGELLFKEGEKVEGIYFINEGKVKVHKQWGPEKELIVRIANKGAIVGHRGLGGDGYYPVSGTALENVDACFIDLAFFESTLKVNHQFTINLLMFFADELQESERKMRNMAHMTVKGRIAQCLLSLHEKFGTSADGCIDIVLSRQDLASFAGTTYETVFRIINDLANTNVIELVGKNIKITNYALLQSFIQETEE